MSFGIQLRGRRPDLAIFDGEKVRAVAEQAAENGEFSLTLDGQTVRGHRWSDAERVWVRVHGRTFAFDRRAMRTTSKADGREEVRADMPGTVVALHTSVGARVASGEPLLTLESMKLQVEVVAERAGVVAAIHVAANDTFERGASLVVIQIGNTEEGEKNEKVSP